MSLATANGIGFKACDHGCKHGIGNAEFAEEKLSALAISLTAITPDVFNASDVGPYLVTQDDGFWWAPEVHRAGVAKTGKSGMHFIGNGACHGPCGF